MSLKLSIIIPVYNVQKYIRKCILSCLNQDIDKSLYEIIVINDGSTDSSLDIITELAEQNEYIQIYTQKNKGLSNTRNFGLNVARGEYVWFVDSDDFIEENCLKSIVRMLDINKPDIMQIQYKLVYEDGAIKYVPPKIIKGVLSGSRVLLSGGLPAPAQFSIFKRLFLIDKKLLFFPGIYHEDSEFKPRAVYFAKSVCFYDGIVYNYLQRVSGSITSKFKLKNACDILQVNKNLYDFLILQVKEPALRRCFYNEIAKNFNTLLLGIRSLSFSERNIVIDKLKENRDLLLLMIRSNNLKYVLEGLIFAINIPFGLFVHKVLKRD